MTTLRLTRLDASVPIANPDGTPTLQFLRLYNKAMDSIETAFNSQDAFLANIILLNGLIVAAGVAITNLNDATAAMTAEQSLNTSRVGNFVGASPISADNLGNVTIANHDRIYGNGDIVPVTGGVVATGYTNPQVARIYYVDPTRLGGAVTYQFTEDEEVAAQTGDTHSVGAVEIPVAGSVDGGWVRPPGYVIPLL